MPSLLKIRNVLWIFFPLLCLIFLIITVGRFHEVILIIDHTHWLGSVILQCLILSDTCLSQVHLLWWRYCHFFVKYKEGFLALFSLLVISYESKEMWKRRGNNWGSTSVEAVMALDAPAVAAILVVFMPVTHSSCSEEWMCFSHVVH